MTVHITVVRQDSGYISCNTKQIRRSYCMQTDVWVFRFHGLGLKPGLILISEYKRVFEYKKVMKQCRRERMRKYKSSTHGYRAVGMVC